MKKKPFFCLEGNEIGGNFDPKMQDEFSDIQLGQLSKVLSALLDKKFDKHLTAIETRFDSLETKVTELQTANRKLKSRVCVLESLAYKTEAEIIGFPLEPKFDPMTVVIQLAKAAGLELKKDHLHTAKRGVHPRRQTG